MRVIKGTNFAELYSKTCRELVENPEYETAPHGQTIKEITNAILINENPSLNLFKNKERPFPMNYLTGELLWYFSGRNDLEFISNYSSFWKSISDNSKSCNSAYGNLLFTKQDAYNKMSQFYWAYSSLVKDKDSRQAIMHFNRPLHQYDGVKDFVCTLIGIFQIRDNKLNFTIDMRSNDIYFGLTFDYPFFTILQQQMYNHLKKIYPELKIGNYTHFAHSLHLYEKDFSKIKKMIDSGFISDKTPTLDTNLIDIYGTPSKDINEICKNINNSNNYISNSIFLKWLSKNSKIQKKRK